MSEIPPVHYQEVYVPGAQLHVPQARVVKKTVQVSQFVMEKKSAVRRWGIQKCENLGANIFDMRRRGRVRAQSGAQQSSRSSRTRVWRRRSASTSRKDGRLRQPWLPQGGISNAEAQLEVFLCFVFCLLLGAVRVVQLTEKNLQPEERRCSIQPD